MVVYVRGGTYGRWYMLGLVYMRGGIYVRGIGRVVLSGVISTKGGIRKGWYV